MRKAILPLTLILVFVFGCAGSGGSSTPSSIVPYLGGSSAIAMEFVNGMPPDFVFDDSGYGFGIGVKLTNVGETLLTADDAYIEVIGINPVDFGLNSQDDLKKNVPVDLAGAKKNFDGTRLPGGETLVEFNDLSYIPDLSGNTGLKIRANLCYVYTTMSSTKVCVKEDLMSDNQLQNEICTLTGEKSPQNSGGPLHITSLKENPMGRDKIQVSFVISHVGSHPGAMFFKYTEDCDTSITNSDKYKVYVEVTSDFSGNLPSCTGLEDPTNGNSAGFVTLFNGNPRTITCTIDTAGVRGVYEDLFTVNLKYRYLQSIERPLEVRDVSIN